MPSTSRCGRGLLLPVGSARPCTNRTNGVTQNARLGLAQTMSNLPQFRKEAELQIAELEESIATMEKTRELLLNQAGSLPEETDDDEDDEKTGEDGPTVASVAPQPEQGVESIVPAEAQEGGEGEEEESDDAEEGEDGEDVEEEEQPERASRRRRALRAVGLA